MRDLGLLIIRVTVGGLLAGHGAQKLFGAFGGYGLQGTGGWLASIGLRPGPWWAALAGFGEFGGGLLTALGLFHPIGPLLTLGPMGVATGTVHAGKPIWVTEGGAELPVTNMAVATGLTLAGPGRFSLDRMLGSKVPAYLAATVAVSVLLGIGAAIASRRAAQQPVAPAATEEAVGEEEEEAEAELQRRRTRGKAQAA
ncbi:MAG: DoxX family protein [Chloroflexi bacterium]|nr:DoxX family protein [Chloroflexota bacterium]